MSGIDPAVERVRLSIEFAVKTGVAMPVMVNSADVLSILSRIERLEEDRARLDFLERHTVNVRVPLVYGSRDLFWATPDRSFEGEEGPSDIRAKIDAFARQALGDA